MLKQLILHLSIKKVINWIPQTTDQFHISKIIEKTMYSTLYKFLGKYNGLHKKQFGFQNPHLTNHALASITGDKKSFR